jgi:soluble lytic murein transglycosylase-like protein
LFRLRPFIRISLVMIAGLLPALPPAAVATPDPSGQCVKAADAAAKEVGVPPDILQAVALAESGRAVGDRLQPWPWAVNFAGQGRWYDDPTSAELAVAERLALGATNVDIGCFQLNYRWHGDAFPSIGAMFDPDRNARYAARFLAEKFAETGDWVEAAAAYHSRSPEHAARYKSRVETLLSGLSSQFAEAVVARVNRYPLLVGGQSGAIGSLVPALAGGTGLIGGAP